jgi:hypothetical protein
VAAVAVGAAAVGAAVVLARAEAAAGPVEAAALGPAEALDQAVVLGPVPALVPAAVPGPMPVPDPAGAAVLLLGLVLGRVVAGIGRPRSASPAAIEVESATAVALAPVRMLDARGALAELVVQEASVALVALVVSGA